MNKLDSLRQVDASTGIIKLSGKYRALEKELSLLLEMYECLHQKCYVENLLSIGKQSNNEDVIVKKRDLRRSLLFFFPFTKCVTINVDESG